MRHALGRGGEGCGVSSQRGRALSRQQQPLLCLAHQQNRGSQYRSPSRSRSSGDAGPPSWLATGRSLTGTPRPVAPAPLGPTPAVTTIPVPHTRPLEAELRDLSPLDAQKCLTMRVKSARTMHDFAEVVSAGGRLVDSICLVAILAGLPRAVQRAALPGTGAAGGAAAGLGLGPGAATHGSRPALAEQDAAALAGLLGGITSLVRIRLREFDSNGLVTVAVGLAKLSGHAAVDPALFRELLAALEPRLGGLGTKPLANLMWALATAGVQPCGSWLSAYYGSVERQVEGFSGGDLANMMWGLAKLDLMPEVWLMDQLLAATLAQLASTHCVADGSTVLTCLARVYNSYSYRPADDRVGALLAALQPGLRAASSPDLVALLHSAVCMSAMPPRSFMLDYYSVLLDKLKAGGAGGAAAGGGGEAALGGGDFSRLLWSMSRVDCTPPRSWLREFVEVSAPRLHVLRHRALTELLWAMACWDAKPSTRWLAAYFAASARRLPDYRPSQVADTLSALAKLGCVAPAGWLHGMMAAFVAQLPDARSHELAAVLESCVAVCDDRAWLATQQRQLQLIADTAASKFALFDCIGHAKLVLALARANCCPGPAWLTQQQASLARCWSAADIDTDTAAGLRQAYRTWAVELDGRLAAELEGRAS